MPINYNNPNDWGKSPLTDKALRLQQYHAENPGTREKAIEADLEALKEHKSATKPPKETPN